MRIVPVLLGVALLLGPTLAPTATARTLWFELTLSGPTTVVAGGPSAYHGQLNFRSGATYVPIALASRDVRLMIDGATVAHATTDALGAFSASIVFPMRGTHSLTAAIDLLSADSNVLRVNAVVPPTMLSLTGIQSSRWNVSHLDWTVDDGGYPVYEFRVYHSVNGSAFAYAGAVGGYARSFDEPVAPGASITYRVEGANFAGAGAPILVTDTTPSAPVDALTSSMNVGWGCECSPSNGWYWGYGYGSAIQSNHHFAGAPTVSGNVASLGAAAVGRVVSVTLSSWLTDYCYPPAACPTQHIYSQSESAQATVAPDGSYSVTLPQITFTWGGGPDATSTNTWHAVATIDGFALALDDGFALNTDPCAPPNPPCGGGF